MSKTEIITHYSNGDKYLVLNEADNTLASIVMLAEVEIYWLDRQVGSKICHEATLVVNPKTIYGATPHCFGIKIPNV